MGEVAAFKLGTRHRSMQPRGGTYRARRDMAFAWLRPRARTMHSRTAPTSHARRAWNTSPLLKALVPTLGAEAGTVGRTESPEETATAEKPTGICVMNCNELENKTIENLTQTKGSEVGW